ncbi:MAG: response regulator transcription factor, partial [Verrucomicrobiota bacterium]
YAEALIQDGANGYVMKDEATKQIIRGLRTILDGNVYLSEAMQRIVINQLRGGRIKRGRVKRSKNHPLAALTQREGEIFNLIGQGLASKEIGERLSISVSTVDVHKSRIRAKLKLSDAPELLRYALTHAGRVTA